MTIQFSCSADALAKAVAFAGQAVQRRNTIPILGALRLTLASGVMTVSGTDLDMQADATIPADGADVAVCINARTLAAMLRGAMPGEVFRLEVVAPDRKNPAGVLSISCGQMTAKLNDMYQAGDWLAPHMGVPMKSMQMPEAMIAKAMRAVSMCISTEETRYYLNGVYMHEADGLAMAATDRHRISLYKTGQEWGLGNATFPRQAAKVLTAKLRDNANGDVAVTAHDRGGLLQLAFAGDGWRIASRSIDGTYPNYNRVIPAPFDGATATLNRAGLRRMAVFGGVDLLIDAGAGAMISRDYNAGEVSLPIQSTGALRIGFNVKYLQDFAILGDIKCSFGPNRNEPARVTTEDPAFLGVIMPRRVE